MTPPPPGAIRRVAALLAIVAAGCGRMEPYLSDTPSDRVVEAALAAWASPGGLFLDGVADRDTVAAVTPTSARAWEVAVIPVTGGAPAVWSLEIPRVEVYPVFDGDAFVSWLGDRSRVLGFASSLPGDVVADVRRGDILSVADVEVRYGPANGSARRTVERVAYRVSMPGGGAQWRIQPDTGSSGVLLGALKYVADDLIHRDRDVLSCMGGSTAVGVARSVQLRCLATVLDQRFGTG